MEDCGLDKIFRDLIPISLPPTFQAVRWKLLDSIPLYVEHRISPELPAAVKVVRRHTSQRGNFAGHDYA